MRFTNRKIFVCESKEFIERYKKSRRFLDFVKSWNGTSEKTILKAIRILRCSRKIRNNSPTMSQITKLTKKIRSGWTNEEEIKRRV